MGPRHREPEVGDPTAARTDDGIGDVGRLLADDRSLRVENVLGNESLRELDSAMGSGAVPSWANRHPDECAAESALDTG